ncbi:MAG TPA: hypothetical protein VLC09_08210, partial [Polyangiaceae bacterium]|nr:hypothetical protein [Polyangiaceae bacterium]
RPNRTGEHKLVRRPKHFFRDDGSMPDHVTLRFARPKSFEDLSAKEWTGLLAKKIRAVEMRAAAACGRLNLHPIGACRVLAQRPTSRPRSREPRRQTNPRVAAKSIWKRVELLQRDRSFLRAYRAARAMLAQGYDYVPFPDGSYWMRRFMAAVCNVDWGPHPELAA